MDDRPIWFAPGAAGRILSVPWPQQLNDIPAIVARKDSAAQSADVIVDNFDEILELAADEALVMGGAATRCGSRTRASSRGISSQGRQRAADRLVRAGTLRRAYTLGW
jgi:hypothetical protein